MNTKEIHLLNILLMAVALGFAILLPFELFLLAYAVLGPLHYLTEINWLNQHDFHLKRKVLIWIPAGITLLVSLPFLSNSLLPREITTAFRPVLYPLISSYPYAVLACLLIAIGLVLQMGKIWWAIICPVILGGLWLLKGISPYYLLGAVLIPSVVHVYFFTLAFMIYGLLKSPDRIGTAEAAALALMPVVIALMPLDITGYSPEASTLSTFRQSGFQPILTSIGKMLNQPDWNDPADFILSESGIRIQIFIAFAYTYHYLNWFSKVSLIGWLRNAGKKRMAYLLAIWIFSVSLYAYDYKLGLGVLFTLSLLHVTLEFPLNIVSIRAIIRYAAGSDVSGNK